MKTYLVGGAVRDRLLDVPHKEQDFVVVGATPAEMLAAGFQQVGKGFPVFLHPKTHEEYALARTERKTGHGYTGFTCYSAPTVTLEEDLRRRDLTINAMAMDENNQLIDPYGGKIDLENKMLRHVSEAFSEDPLRVLRVARFAARFGDFTIDPETVRLLREITASGELNTLTPERVFTELAKALHENFPERFFQVLYDVGALQVLLPEMIPHFTEAVAYLKNAVKSSPKPEVRFAAFFSGLQREEIRLICRRFRIAHLYLDLCYLVIGAGGDFKNALTLMPEQIINLLERLDAFRRVERFHDWLLACEACHVSQSEFSPQFKHLTRAYNLVHDVSVAPFLAKGINGFNLKMALYQERIRLLSEKI